MALSDAQIRAVIEQQLTPQERRNGVAYVAGTPAKAQSTLYFPQATIPVPWDATVAFVDREPLANWGHSARYILVNRETGAVISVETRFPPFRSDDPLHWSVVYRAPSVPDAAIAVPKSKKE